MCSRKERLWRRVGRSRWFIIVVGIWIQCSGGSSYDFGVYSQTLKTALHYDQLELDTVSVFKDVGANVGIVSGLLYDTSSPWIVLLVAAVESFFGYFMMWLAVSLKIPRPSLWQMCSYMCVAANAQTFMNTAVVVTCVKIFPSNRGTVVGLMKGFLGLSGAILVQSYHAIYANDQSSFILLISWLIPSVCLSFMFILRPLPVVEDENETKLFDRFSLLALVLSFYLLGVILFQNIVTFGRAWSISIFLVILFILLFPLWVVVKVELQSEVLGVAYSESDSFLHEIDQNRTDVSCHGNYSEDVETALLADMSLDKVETNQRRSPLEPGIGHQHLASIQEDSKGSPSDSNLQYQNFSNCAEVDMELESGHDLTLLQAMRVLDFWILFFCTACGMGSGLTTINNMSQLGSSLGYAQREISTLVSLWSIWNFLGRLGAGYVSEVYLHSKGIPRPLFMAITLATMAFGHLMIGAAFPCALYLGSILVGLSYGSQWSLMPAMTSELFGLQHFGTLFNTITIASPLGSYILSVKVAGTLYDFEAKKGASKPTILHLSSLFSPGEYESLSCNGPHCFRLTFFIMAAVCFSGFITSSWLCVRTSTLYKIHIYQRLHHNRM
eukprot:c27099_g1_i1 orf=469-2301(-)